MMIVAPLAMILAITLSGGNTAASVSSGRATSEFGVAAYNDRCSRDSEIVGHPIMGYVDDAHGITNEYPIGVVGQPHLILGYIYTTLGGTAYFVPSERAFQLGIAKFSDSASMPLGANTLIGQHDQLSSEAIKGIRALLKTAVLPRFLLAKPHGPACYSRDWDGKITSHG